MFSVLIVEDDPMVAKINKSYVESVNNFKVIAIVEDYKKAISFLKKNDVDLVILDIYLPGEDGISILEEIRKHNYACDVIMVTASAEVNDIDKALKLGVIDYLIKPFEYERMKIALERYQSKYNTLNKQNTIKQEDLDKILVNKSLIKDNTIPKGISRSTLNKILSFIKEKGDKPLSADEIGQELNITPVTVRRYMNYLEKIGFVIHITEYGSVGRPSYLYKKAN
jgi:response regulator of citrate/malate metabolism